MRVCRDIVKTVCFSPSRLKRHSQVVGRMGEEMRRLRWNSFDFTASLPM